MIIKCAVFFFLLLNSAQVSANVNGNDTHIFNPSTGEAGFVSVHGASPVRQGVLNSNLFISQAMNSLPPTWDSLGVKSVSHDSVLFSDFTMAYGLTEKVEICSAFTYLWDQNTTRDESGAHFGGVGLNDIRFGGKLHFSDTTPFGAAFQTSANINVAKNNPFVGVDSGPIFNFEGILDYTVNEFLFAANLGYRLRQNGSEVPNSVYKPLPDYAIASAAMRFMSSEVPIGFNLEIYGAKPVRPPDSAASDQALSEVLVGGFYRIRESAKAFLGYGRQTGTGLFAAEERYYAGLSFPIELNPPPLARFEEDVMQPKQTVNVIEVRNTFLGFQPAEIENMKSISFNTLTQQHEFKLQTKMPAKDVKQKPPFEVLRLENFDFDFGSSEIRAEYAPLLRDLASYLSSEPKVLKVRIEGHTDSLGSEERNRKRSQSRADALKIYLKKNYAELSEVPIEAIGFGSDKPIADNTLPEGRIKNRRVEVRILRQIQNLQKTGTSQ